MIRNIRRAVDVVIPQSPVPWAIVIGLVLIWACVGRALLG